jgi:hypothetical protein
MSFDVGNATAHGIFVLTIKPPESHINGNESKIISKTALLVGILDDTPRTAVA